MAWIAPTTRTTGELITASIWNTDITDNLDALKDPPSENYEANEAADYSTSSTTFVNVDATNLALTITTTGGDVLVGFHGALQITSTYILYFDLDVDGSREGGDDGITCIEQAIDAKNVAFVRLITGLSAGSHTIKLQWKTSNGGAVAKLWAGAGTASYDLHPQFWLREAS